MGIRLTDSAAPVAVRWSAHRVSTGPSGAGWVDTSDTVDPVVAMCVIPEVR